MTDQRQSESTAAGSGPGTVRPGELAGAGRASRGGKGSRGELLHFDHAAGHRHATEAEALACRADYRELWADWLQQISYPYDITFWEEEGRTIPILPPAEVLDRLAELWAEREGGVQPVEEYRAMIADEVGEDRG